TWINLSWVPLELSQWINNPRCGTICLPPIVPMEQQLSVRNVLLPTNCPYGTRTLDAERFATHQLSLWDKNPRCGTFCYPPIVPMGQEPSVRNVSLPSNCPYGTRTLGAERFATLQLSLRDTIDRCGMIRAAIPPSHRYGC